MLIAGEASGDLLAAELVSALRGQLQDAQFFGAGGTKMVAAGGASEAATLVQLEGPLQCRHCGTHTTSSRKKGGGATTLCKACYPKT